MAKRRTPAQRAASRANLAKARAAKKYVPVRASVKRRRARMLSVNGLTQLDASRLHRAKRGAVRRTPAQRAAGVRFGASMTVADSQWAAGWYGGKAADYSRNEKGDLVNQVRRRPNRRGTAPSGTIPGAR